MKLRSIFFLFVFTNAIAQNGNIFQINIYEISKKNESSIIKDTERANFFEDEDYTVTKSCSGEWGGSIRFKDKKTGIQYECQSTCAVIVNKFKGKYIITNTLPHLMGFSEILEIQNPKSLKIYNPPVRNSVGKIRIVAIGDDESKSTQGTKVLVDSTRTEILMTFPYKEKLYHIVTDFDKTFVSELVNGKLQTIDTISEYSLWTYDPKVLINKEEHYIVHFENEKVKGYIDVYNGSIKVYKIE